MTEILFFKVKKECYRKSFFNGNESVEHFDLKEKKWKNVGEIDLNLFEFELKINLKIIQNGQTKRYGDTIREAEIEYFFLKNNEQKIDEEQVKKFISKNFDHAIFYKNSNNYFYGTYTISKITETKFRYHSVEPYCD